MELLEAYTTVVETVQKEMGGRTGRGGSLRQVPPFPPTHEGSCGRRNEATGQVR